MSNMVFVWTLESVIQAAFIGFLVLIGLLFGALVLVDKIKRVVRGWFRP